uniref:Acid phosphatase n=1 Tax=Plectus sambesii TaxID=2011161 RepID=A0A914UNP5_9BILA
MGGSEFPAMMMLAVFLILHGSLVIADLEVSETRESVARDPNTKLVFVGTRHGNRNPAQFLKNITSWGKEGEMELTSFGKRQAYGLGVSVRSFVGDLVESNYLSKETKAYSSSANRCQMTLQAALAGIFPPQDFAEWNQKLDWTPVPYQIDDPMLRMYAVSPCPNSDAAWQPISDDNLPELVRLTREKKAFMDHVASHTGWNASISNMADVADNLIEIQLYNSPMPDWIARPTLPGYDEARMIKEILEFSENHQNMCADYAPCRNLMGGVWLKHILDTLKKQVDGKANDLNLVIYASHTEVTLSVMKLLYNDQHEVTTSAGFVLEFRDKPAPSVRLLSHEPGHNNVDEHTIYQATYLPQLKAICPGNWCPLDAFIRLVSGTAIDDWKAGCGVLKCDEKKPDNSGTANVATTALSADSNTSATSSSGFDRDCAREVDELGAYCSVWARHGFCAMHRPTKYLHCRKTCLCDKPAVQLPAALRAT